MQSQVFPIIHGTDENILVCAPARWGKTLCHELALLRAFAKQAKSRCVYIAPLAALVDDSERAEEWKDLFGAATGMNKLVETLSGESSHDLAVLRLKRADVILSTPEHWDTPFGIPPFAAITPEHYPPAFAAAFAEHKAEIAAMKGQMLSPPVPIITMKRL